MKLVRINRQSDMNESFYIYIDPEDNNHYMKDPETSDEKKLMDILSQVGREYLKDAQPRWIKSDEFLSVNQIGLGNDDYYGPKGAVDISLELWHRVGDKYDYYHCDCDDMDDAIKTAKKLLDNVKRYCFDIPSNNRKCRTIKWAMEKAGFYRTSRR